jgi:hypothetical protein
MGSQGWRRASERCSPVVMAAVGLLDVACNLADLEMPMLWAKLMYLRAKQC